MQYFTAAEADADPLDGERLAVAGGQARLGRDHRVPVRHHSLAVEILSATALRSAWTSASIHDW